VNVPIKDAVIRVDVDEVKGETPKAILVLVEGEEFWVPKSVIIVDESDTMGEGDRGTLVVQGWFGREKGWD
jgi:hypothetical protein